MGNGWPFPINYVLCIPSSRGALLSNTLVGPELTKFIFVIDSKTFQEALTNKNFIQFTF